LCKGCWTTFQRQSKYAQSKEEKCKKNQEKNKVRWEEAKKRSKKEKEEKEEKDYSRAGCGVFSTTKQDKWYNNSFLDAFKVSEWLTNW